MKSSRPILSFLFISLLYYPLIGWSNSVEITSMRDWDEMLVSQAEARAQRFLGLTKLEGREKQRGAELIRKNIAISARTHGTDQYKDTLKIARDLSQVDDLIIRTEVIHILFSNADFLTNDQVIANPAPADAVKLIEESQYPPEDNFRFLRLYIDMRKGTDSKLDFEKFNVLMCRELKLWLKAIDFSKVNDRYVFSEIEDVIDRKLYDLKVLAKSLDELVFLKQKKPWLWNMIQGTYWREKAWESRGTGYAHTVTEDGWKGFRHGLSQASLYYQKAYEIRPECPEATGMMVSVASVYNTEESAETWLQRSIDAQFDWKLGYEGKLHFLQPQWGGSFEEMLQFGREAVATERYDTPVPFFFFHTVRTILMKGEAGVKFAKQNGVYETATEVSNKYISHSHPSYPEANLDRMMYELAMLLDQYGEVERFHRKLGMPDSGQARYYLKRMNRRKIPIAYAMNTRFSELATEVEAKTFFYVERNNAERKQLIEKCLEASKLVPDGMARHFFDRYAKLLQDEVDFENGQKVLIDFDETMLDWIGFCPFYRVLSNNALLIGASSTVGVRPYSRKMFNPPYVLEVDVNLRSTPMVNTATFSGVSIGRLTSGEKKGRLFFCNPRYGQIGGVKEKEKYAWRKWKTPNQYKLKIRVWEGSYEIFHNDAFVAGDYSTDFIPGHIGLGFIPTQVSGGQIEYRDLHIRKITMKTPPQGLEARIDYFTKRLQRENYWSLYLNRAEAYFELGKYHESQQDFEKVLPKAKHAAQIYTRLAQAFHFQGDYKQARIYHEKSLENAKKSPFLAKRGKWIWERTHCALFYATCPDEEFRDPVKALTIVKQLAEQTKQKDAFVLSTLGCAYSTTGEFEQAIKWCEKAIKIDNENEDYKEQLSYFKTSQPFLK